MANRDLYFTRKINIKKGISGSADVLGERVEREGRPQTFLEPGDIAVKDRVAEDIIKQFRAPIAYDVWYLNHFVNMLSRDSEGTDSISEEYVNDQLSFLEENFKGVKPMSFLRDLDSLIPPFSGPFWDPWRGNVIPEQWLELSEYFINMLAYEIWHPKIPAQCDSAGPERERGFDRDKAVGYLAFPVGQFGVMEVVSILKQTEAEKDGFEIRDEQSPITESSSGFMFPPTDRYTGKNKCLGEHIIESAYLIPKNNLSPDQPDKRISIEVMASPLSTDLYADIRPQYWMRYWIHEDEKFPVPGEFVGILVKSLALPPHVWWFQRTCPYIHAGNWIETNSLTSGTVMSITKEADRTDSGVGDQYKVRVQGWDILIETSDFLEYEVGDRVGVLKLPSVKEESVETSFIWSDMPELEAKDKNEKNGDYIILPIEFYKEEA